MTNRTRARVNSHREVAAGDDAVARAREVCAKGARRSRRARETRERERERADEWMDERTDERTNASVSMVTRFVGIFDAIARL